MPVGTVFDPRVGQVLPRPTAAAAGRKALNAQTEGQLLSNEAAAFQIGNQEEDRERAIAAEKKSQELMDAQIGEYGRKVGADKAVSEANDFIGIWGGIEELIGGGAPQEDITAFADKEMDRWIQTMEVSPETNALIEKSKDGWQQEELVQLYKTAMATNKQFSSGATAKPDYTLGKGRYSGETDELIAGIAPSEGGEGGEGGRQRDDEIADATKILTDMGVADPETEAIKQVDGKIIYTIDPNGGTIYRTDKITGKTTEVEIQGGERGPAPEIAYEDTLHGLADEATGVGPGAKAALAAGVGPLGGYTAEATTKAKAKFKAAENTLIRAFSLNPRYPVAEQERIRGNIQIQPKFWDSAEQMRHRMSGIRDFLEQERDIAVWESSRPGIGRTQKTLEENTVADFDRFLSGLGKPPEAAPELSDLPPPPPGIDPEDWRYFTPEARERASAGQP